MDEKSNILNTVAQNAASASGKMSAASGVTTSFLAFFGQNAAAIGGLCTLLTFISMWIFKIIDIRMKKRMTEEYFRAKFKEEAENGESKKD